MGFQGQLSSVNLTDIFQTLHMNRQTGTLTVSSPAGVQHVYFESGQISLCGAPPVDGRACLLNALLRKDHLSPEQAAELQQKAQGPRQSLREALRASGYVDETTLDEVCAWCIEELVCPIFEWQEGDFSFADGAPIPELTGINVVAMGQVGLQTTQLILEATRRNDEWKRIREVVTDANTYYVVDNEGRNNLRNIQTDPEMLKVLRYLDGRHTLDAISTAVGVTRFDTFAITAQLVLAGIARPRTAEENVADATALRAAGELEQARGLLENTLHLNNVPEVIRPLAEIYAELKQAPRAVELYLELIQFAQDQGDLEQARADLDMVLSLSPDDPELQFDRAKVLGELGAMEDAANSYVAAAQAFLISRDTARAIDACHRAKNLLPRSPDPHRFLAKAYLMDGQTENSLVEYKSLWHALLTAERPRRALEILRDTLETDCRFNNIKEQVLNHAQNSEAIKTSKAMRVLVYVVMFLLLVSAGLVGFQVWQKVVRVGQAKTALEALKATKIDKEQAGLYSELFEGIRNLRTTYSNTPVIDDVDALEKEIRGAYEARADDQIKLSRDYQAAGKHDQSVACLHLVIARFQGTKAEEQAKLLLAAANEDQVTREVKGLVDAAQKQWSALDWDAALAALQQGVLPRKDLSKNLAAEIAALANDWSEKLENAKDLYERAEHFEQSGRKKEALAAYARASKGKGELYAGKARDRLTALEVEFAQETGQAALQAFERNDDKQAFALLDELAAQVKRATGKGVADYVARLVLPFVVKLDSQFITLTVKRVGSPDQAVKAPPGVRGPWSHRITYQPTETLAIEARRPGFTTQTLAVSFQARRSQATITLARGALWSTDLGAIAITAPVPNGKFILVGTNRATLEVIDTGLGTSRPVAFPDTVDEFRLPPVVFQNLAYTIIDNHLTATDIITRTPLWSYPSDPRTARMRLAGSLWVQEHELIPGQLLVFMAGAKGELLAFARDQSGTNIPYPHVVLSNDITGPLMGDQFEPGKTVLYVPTGNSINAFDTTAATEHTPAAPLFSFRTRGEVTTRLVRAVVAGRPALLAIDNSGLLIGVDANPAAPDNKRALGSWALDGTGMGGAAYLAGQNVAYVAMAEGRIVAVDLARPGQLLWRFPAQGNAGPLAGAPAIGLRGIYVADGNGTLHCVDAQTGSERWHADLGSPVTTGILAHDGRVYVPTHNGFIACFEEGDD